MGYPVEFRRKVFKLKEKKGHTIAASHGVLSTR
ncbi:hypothetical protein Psal071_01709 [Piscirickettsia salmonis]|uniref:Uncharacterized protein n=1 Tax=Piscirickettsia salmonis TaxID=1238 RepID=A0A9Q6PX34_PISSA|nr:hypothetical protein KW89_1625 [Piscirickettsia salmonis]QGN94984.1 hypothetical protein Psal006a_01591 [Piscirickettsia salmonis]QGO06066.1 hypothetical protein Psal009_01968 [Piscirickettsia salmonis]QGO34392.1 hypothetical protein Psal028_01719 [Piscirickettsia salmonis]QGO37998.1 hypothetical protein Psal040_01714 [Piscirickettsia salmonis]